MPVADLSTVEFACLHRFCSECTIEQLKGTIEVAGFDKLKCFDYECGKPISLGRIQTILTERS